VTVAELSEIDLFDDDVLRDPYPVLRRLRDVGPAVYLPRHDVWFVGRYADVKACLAAPDTFSAHRGVGMSEQFNRLSAGTAVLTSEGETHRLLREILMRDLNTPRFRGIQDQVDAEAERLVAGLVARGRFDAVNDLARVFPLSVVCAFLGLPLQDRKEILRLADAGINSFGPINERTLGAFPQYHELLKYLATVAVPPHLLPGGAGETFYRAVEDGEIDAATAAGLVSTYLVAGVDTTINSVSNALNLFGAHPEQWRRVRRDPAVLVPQALREVLRHDPPVQMMTRTITQDAEIGGVRVPEGQRVMLSYASACRDERKYADPDRFDIDRNPRDHLALGHGVHNCVGSGLARLEAHAVLHAFARQVDTFTCGPARRHLNNVVRGLDHLPVEITRLADGAAEPLVPVGHEGGVPAALGGQEAGLEAGVRPELVHEQPHVPAECPHGHAEHAGGGGVGVARDQERQDLPPLVGGEPAGPGTREVVALGGVAAAPVGEGELREGGAHLCPVQHDPLLTGPDRPEQRDLPIYDE
jgi:cytochrome P450